jgi:hypothetical protein
MPLPRHFTSDARQVIPQTMFFKYFSQRPVDANTSMLTGNFTWILQKMLETCEDARTCLSLHSLRAKNETASSNYIGISFQTSVERELTQIRVISNPMAVYCKLAFSHAGENVIQRVGGWTSIFWSTAKWIVACYATFSMVKQNVLLPFADLNLPDEDHQINVAYKVAKG